MFNFALEAMQASTGSKFGQELDKLWQSVIDYRDKELANETNIKMKYRNIREFFEKHVAQKFLDTVWKYLGFYIKKIEYVEIWESGFCTMIYLGPKGQEGTLQVEAILDGGYIKRYWDVNFQNVISAKELVQMATSYDKIHGCIKEEHRNKIKKMVNAKLGFDVRTGFMLADFLPKNSGVENFTAQEITAIILHEIGHTLTLVEHAADCYAQISSFSYLTSAFQQRYDDNPVEVAKLARATADKIEDRGNKDVAKKLRDLTNKFESDVAETRCSADPSAKRALIGGLIQITFGLLFDVPCILIDALSGTMADKRFAGSSEQKTKYSDLPVNERLCTWQERKADEYAFTHGYGKHQVTALAKLTKMLNRYGMSEKEIAKLDAAEKVGKGVSFLDKMKLNIFAPQMCGDWSYSLYPAGVKRFKELLNLTIQQLKAHSTDPAIVAHYMKDIEAIMEHIEHCDQYDEYREKCLKRYELFMSYVSLPNFIDWLVHGRIKRELETLLNDLQSMSNNLIVYYGYKLQQLAKKDK